MEKDIGWEVIVLFGLTKYLPEIYLSWYDNLEFLIRIVLAAALGGSIGLERSIREKGAGIRTHCIVAVASAVFMILSKYAFMDLVDVNGVKAADSARIAAQVVSGISFLGAGIIFKQEKGSVVGLTTAAGIWATAAIGLTVGAGLYWVSFYTTVILLFLQFILHKHPRGSYTFVDQEIRIKMKDEPEIQNAFDDFMKKRKFIVEKSTILRTEGQIEIRLNVRIDNPVEFEECAAFMKKHPQVIRFSV